MKFDRHSKSIPGRPWHKYSDTSKKYAKEDLKEVAKYMFDEMRYNPIAETFNDLLHNIKKAARQAFGDGSRDITETFLVAKLPV